MHKTYPQACADVIRNYVAPLKEQNPSMTVEDFKPQLLARVIALYAEGKIDAHRLRRWIIERVGERELEEKLCKAGSSMKTMAMMDLLEVEALENNYA